MSGRRWSFVSGQRCLYSDQAISNADAAVDVMRKELMQQDREVLCVVNLNAKMKPINFNIVSVGNLIQTVVVDLFGIHGKPLYSKIKSIIIIFDWMMQ